MPTIRSLLWIGSGRGLAASGITEAPELDVTWVPDLAEAAKLPRVPFDGVLLEAEGAGAIGAAVARAGAIGRGVPVLLCLPPDCAEASQAAIAAGAAAVLQLDPEAVRPGFVRAVGDALDAEHERAAARTPRPPIPVNAANSAGAASAANAASTAFQTNAAPAPDASDALPPPFVARSDAMREVAELVAVAASSPSTVLLTGETGAGKEVVARQLHAQSGRAALPFVAINCAAFPEALLESELFGHVKGAFTGADRNKPGLFETAGAGTLFLDEIAEMELALQAKLLRVLQEREIRPIGGTRSIPVTCRIVAATNRVLQDEVRSGHFREDLYYRLNVFPIRIPPLRERRKDILPLARHFLALHGPREGKRDCHLSLATAQLLECYAWPGNVRELENEMLRVLMLTPSGSLVTPKVLSRKLVEILEPIAHGGGPEETLRQAVERVEAWLIRRALANNGGQKASTARRLGITREGLYKKMRRLGIG
ncbi:MAG: sigma 54-interacting transcriptional regulator [Myxococcota bacterium]